MQDRMLENLQRAQTQARYMYEMTAPHRLALLAHRKGMDGAAEWVMDTDAGPLRLRPSLWALAAIEESLGRSIFAIIDAASHHGLTIANAAVIAAVLTDDFPNGEPSVDAGSDAGVSLSERIMSAGIMTATSQLLAPLAAFLAGKVTPEGALKEA